VQRADGTHLLFLWRTASVWNRDTKQPIKVAARRLSLWLPTASGVEVGNPLSSTGMFPVRLDATSRRATVDVGGDPLVLRVRTSAAT
jgi:hypothetical protein